MDKCRIKTGTDTSLQRIRDQFINNYFNYGRTYDSDGYDTTVIRLDRAPGTTYKDIIKNGMLQWPDSLNVGTTPYIMGAGLISWRDSACLDGYMNMEVRMKDSIAPWETFHGYTFDLYFSARNPLSKYEKYYINLNAFTLSSNYVIKVTGNVQNNLLIGNLSSFQQNYNGWHTLNFEMVDSLFKFYYDGQLKETLTFPGVRREKFFAGGLVTRADRNKSVQFDYVKCTDRNGKVFYFEDFIDTSKFSVFEPYIQCPRPPCTTAFTTYYNLQKQTSYAWSQIDSIYAAHGITLNMCDTVPPMLCGKTEPVIVPDDWKPRTACDDSTLFATSTGVLLHEAYRDSLIGNFNDRYLAKCLNARYNESFTVYQPVSEFHYTLYYYDQAGNLLKTIPPEGVDVSKFAWARAWSDSVTIARRNKQLLTPKHTLPTKYRYNTLNQVVAQQSPDGGKSEFWYDRLGRLVVSRNARQKAASGTEENRLYSYTRYDSLGRITEVGQVSNTGANGAMSNAISRDPSLLNNWLLTLNNRRGQITNTVYDLP
jgi:YD repeat-containing protein